MRIKNRPSTRIPNLEIKLHTEFGLRRNYNLLYEGQPISYSEAIALTRSIGSHTFHSNPSGTTVEIIRR